MRNVSLVARDTRLSEVLTRLAQALDFRLDFGSDSDPVVTVVDTTPPVIVSGPALSPVSADAGCQAQVITASTIQTCRQQKRSAFAFMRDAVCGLVQSIFSAVLGKSPSRSEPLPLPIGVR